MMEKGGVFMVRKSWLSFLLCCLFSLTFFGLGGQVSAEDIPAVVIYMESPAKSVKAGEDVSVWIELSSVPHIAEFSGMKIGFDASVLRLDGVHVAEDLPFDFQMNYVVKDATVQISGSFSALAGSGSSGDESDPSGAPEGSTSGLPEDTDANSVFVGTPVTVIELRFHVMEGAASRSVSFHMKNPGIFLDRHHQPILSGSGADIGWEIKGELSSIASLLELETSVPIFPEFSPEVYAYYATVPKYVESFSVFPKAEHDRALVDVVSSGHLRLGNNSILVRVTAEDGFSVREYSITIHRESHDGEGLALTNARGESFLLGDIPKDFSAPYGSERKIVTCQDQSFVAFSLPGTEHFYVFLKNAADETELFLYVNSQREMIPFGSVRFIVSGDALYFVETPEIEVPKDFSPTNLHYDGETLPAFAHSTETSYLLYLKNEAGRADFYFFDSITGNIFPYEDIVFENHFFIPFVVIGLFALMEFAVLLILLKQPRRTKS